MTLIYKTVKASLANWKMDQKNDGQNHSKTGHKLCPEKNHSNTVLSSFAMVTNIILSSKNLAALNIQ
jgi:N-acetylmuramoyl-L-alanine amidase CwlA